jgi:Pentapeptide repeats (9 copies)/Pentapeptide repeats (8 copies)
VVALVTGYRRQRVAEFAQELADRAQELADRAEDREAARLFNERFGEAAGQLGHDSAAVRLAGVYAMARLADDWPAQRQTCVDVLCAYLRMPYQPAPGPDAPATDQQAFRSLREVRHTVIRVITAHLQPGGPAALITQDWRGLSLDFTGTVFDGGDFGGAQFTGTVSFRGARFDGGEVSFGGAQFTGTVSFRGARFDGGEVSFRGARFTGGAVSFARARFAGGRVSFALAWFTGAEVSFSSAEFAGGKVSFSSAEFAGGKVIFSGARFTGGKVSFDSTMGWSAPPVGIDWNDSPPGVVAPGTGAAGTDASTSGP